MASLFGIGSSRRKAELPGKIRIQFKSKATEVSSDEGDLMDESIDDQLPVTFGNRIPDDLPEGTIVVQPEAVEDSLVKKKHNAPVRIDTSVLDNVNCTACGRQLNPYKNRALQKHPELKVVICKHCEKFLSSGEISKDQDGADEQCRWCGEGGRLLVCDDCSSAFCKSCVMRNFGRSEFNNINKQDNWQCYLCNKAPLQSLHDNYRKIRDTLKALQEKQKEKKACPTSIATHPSGRSVGSKQSSTGTCSNSSTNGGKMSQVVSNRKNCNDSASSTLIALADLNVKSENVETTIDKLFTSTSTFTGVLQALRSQSHFSDCGISNAQQKRELQTRALNKSLETYLKSLKKILTESLHTHEEQLTCAQDVNPAKLKTKQSTPSLSKTHSSLLSYLSTNSGTMPRGTSRELSTSDNCIEVRKPLQQRTPASNSVAIGESEVLQKVNAELPKVTAKQAECVKITNGDLSDEVDFVTSKSQSSKKSSKDSETRRDTPKFSVDKCTVSITDIANIPNTAIDDIKSFIKDSDTSSKDNTIECVSDRNSKDVNDKDLIQGGEKSDRSERVSVRGKTNNTEIETSSNHSTKNKAKSDKGVKNVSGKKTRSDTLSEESSEEDQIEGTNVHKSSDEALRGLSADQNKTAQEETPISSTCSTYNDENMAAKLDLIKDFTDEGLRHDRDSDDEDDEDLPITFGEEIKTSSEVNLKKVVPKRRKSQVSSDEGTGASEKKLKVSNRTDAKKSSKKPADENNKKTNSKQKQAVIDLGAASDASSSDLLLSDDDDDVDLTTRKRKKKNKNIQKTPEKNQTAEKDSEKNNKPLTKPLSIQVEDIDKEIAKLSKLPTMRKRKAADVKEDDEVAEEKESVVSEVSQKTQKKSKPGPKCSKKGVDYDNLSSDENKEKDDEEDIDEEDEPTVTFFNNTVDTADQKDQNMDENERAKIGLLEDMESENDNSDDDEDDASSDEDSGKDAAKKTKKKEPKKSNDVKKEIDTDAEKESDSDENVGKRKKIYNKLLNAKLSDSDSDVGKPKKKKKSDEESFKAEDSSDSSPNSSDVSEDDDDDESNNTEDEDDESKSKKKGKKKSNKKKRKGKGKNKRDDDLEEEDEDSEDEGKKNKKGKAMKRRRIKRMSNSSDDRDKEEEDDDDPNSSKAGKRKQIRKVMSNKKLEDSTKAATKAEEKRRKRIAAKQREFNIETITDENNPMDCPVTTKLILEAGKEEGDEPVIEVNKKLVRKLKPHQVEAVQFLWDCLYESVKRSKKSEGAGCILAHCMGLGKTLSVIAFAHTILTHQKILKHRTCLVVSPLNTVLNWKNEWDMWLDEEDQLEVWELTGCKQNAARASNLQDWHESGGIMILGYEMYRNLTTGNRCKNKKQKKIFQETLVDPGPDFVICDEGHILKNEASAISKAMNLMKTKRRVVLTGTPLQNNLTEYHCMVSFVKPNLLGTRKEFTNRFISPIQNGQCTDSTPADFKLMKARAHVLHEMLAGCVQRRDYSALTKFLPPKQEYVISVRLTDIQVELYEKYLELTVQGVDGVFSNKGARLFTDYQNLMKIWTHPWVLKLAEIRDELKVKYDDEDSFVDDDDTEEESFSSSSSSSDDDKSMSDSAGEGTSAKPSTQRGTRRTRAKARRQAGEDSDPEEVIAEWKTKRTSNKNGDGDLTQMEESDRSVTKDWWAPYVTEDDKTKLELSNKLYLLFEILRMCEEIGDKVLIFSQSILSLNIIESFLEVIDTKYQEECDNMTEEEKEQQGAFGRSWTKNLDYYRMDGSTSAQNRQIWASNFNDIENYRTRLFLISTKAGGLGINLVAANRVIIFDASWNPSHDVQSIFRVYRFGQTKPCYIYRFLAQGTMEEKIYERQVTKLSLSQRVVDEHQIERHFSANDLKELYNFRPDRLDDGTEKPTLALPKDPLLAEILTANKHCVVTFHEHDSLLENQIEQTLTEEEKKAAWEEYENEKKGTIAKGSGTSWPMMAAAQFLSREEITAIVQVLRQQLPDVSEELFQLHVQQALKRQVQIKQEEKRMELLRLNYMNMMKQQNLQSGLSRGQFSQNMPPWMQMQLRTMQQNHMMMSGSHMGFNAPPQPLPSLPASKYLQGQKLKNPNPISNKPEEAIDLDEN